MHDAPELSVTDPRGAKDQVTLEEGAIVRWVAVAPLLFPKSRENELKNES